MKALNNGVILAPTYFFNHVVTGLCKATKEEYMGTVIYLMLISFLKLSMCVGLLNAPRLSKGQYEYPQYLGAFL